jgi:LysR family transcriptional regulator for metE and metH
VAHDIIRYMKRMHVAEAPSLLDVEIRHLRLVVALEESRSVTRAGQALHLTQSALSHQLSDLEARLNAQLFTRTRSGLVPTAPGHQLLKVAHEVLGRLRAAQTEFALAGGQPAGTLRITTECYTCYRWLPQVLRRMSARLPGVEVFVDVNATNRPLQALSEDQVDLVLMFSNVERGAFVARPLFEDEWVAVVAPQHPLADRSYLRAADFANQTAILYTSPRRDMMVFREFFNPSRVEPRKVLHVQLTEAMIELAKANLGIAILTRWSVEPELRSGSLIALRLDRGGLRRTWHAVYRKQKGTPAYLQEFIRLIKTGFPSGPALSIVAAAGS